MKTRQISENTQCGRVLKALRDAKGEWVNGQYFLRELFLSQYHARIYELQDAGYDIQASDFKNEHGFVYYRIVEKLEQKTLL